ncbi:MAG: metallophosphoesterase [Bdellovibrionales bacterium]|nr:metallophosphoesterase [Bdellovibrionales bacterium]
MTQFSVDTPQKIDAHLLPCPPRAAIRQQFLFDLSSIPLPGLETITQVSAAEIAACPEAKTAELGKFSKLVRAGLARFDHNWDAPDNLKKGGVRVSESKKLELEPSPYRENIPLTTAQRQELRAIARSGRRVNLSHYSSLYEFSVPVAQLPKAFEGFTVLHLTDLHFRKGSTRPIREAHALARYISGIETKIDLVAFTGDDISGHPDDLCPQALEAYQRILDAAGQPYALRTAGNHDYYPGVSVLGRDASQDVSQKLANVGILDVTGKHVTLEHEGASLHILGMDDYTEGQPIPPVKRDVALNGPSILLVHDLSAVRADCTEVDLILSGHTHWGEIRIPFFIDGTRFMKWRGFSDAYNGQVRGWDRLSDKTLSYVGPGSARHSVWSPVFTKPGPSLLRLTAKLP